jgi:hypothetical protein
MGELRRQTIRLAYRLSGEKRRRLLRVLLASSDSFVETLRREMARVAERYPHPRAQEQYVAQLTRSMYQEIQDVADEYVADHLDSDRFGIKGSRDLKVYEEEQEVAGELYGLSASYPASARLDIYGGKIPEKVLLKVLADTIRRLSKNRAKLTDLESSWEAIKGVLAHEVMQVPARVELFPDLPETTLMAVEAKVAQEVDGEVYGDGQTWVDSYGVKLRFKKVDVHDRLWLGGVGFAIGFKFDVVRISPRWAI